jgi:hypothetical protein
MTGSAPQHRLPGDRLLTLARLVFDEPALSTIIRPALADLQREVQDAPGSAGRLSARVRGYIAFWKLVAAAPFMFPVSPTARPLATLLLGASGGNALLVFVVALAVVSWPMFGSFIVAAAIGGAFVAVALRRWYTRHPSALAPDNPLASRPKAEINLSSIPVAGDIGGLFFVVGAVMTVLLGVPAVRWFILGSIIGGCMLAVGVFAWRSSHPAKVSAASSILLR